MHSLSKRLRSGNLQCVNYEAVRVINACASYMLNSYCSQGTNPGTGLLGSGAIWAWVFMIIVSGAGTGEIKLPPSFS